jgi:hypothetical protein
MRMRIDSAYTFPFTHLNDLLIEGHSGEEGQGHKRVWSEILFLLGLNLLNRMHPSLPSCPRTYVCRVVADRSLCKAFILVCAAVS